MSNTTMPRSGGADIALGRVFLRAPGGPVTLGGGRLFDAHGTQIFSGSGGALALALTDQWQSFEALFRAAAAGGATQWERHKDSAKGALFNAAGVQVDVSLGDESAFTPTFSRAAAEAVGFGEGLPREAVGADVAAAISGTIAAVLTEVTYNEDSPASNLGRGLRIFGVRQDVPASGVSASGDFDDVKLTAQGRLRSAGAFEQPPATVAAVVNAGDAVECDVIGMGLVAFAMTIGTTVTVQPEASLDGVTWVSVDHMPLGASISNTAATTVLGSVATVRIARVLGFSRFRLRMTAGSGATLRLQPMAQTLSMEPNVNGGGMQVGGGVGVGSAVAGLPVAVALEARASDIAALANGQVSRHSASLLGKALVLPYTLPGQVVRGLVSLAAVGDNVLLAAPGAGIRNYVTSLVVSNPTTTNNEIIVKDGSTEVMRIPAPKDSGGAIVALPVPLRLAAAAALNVALASAPGGNVAVTAIGFTAGE